MIELTENAVAQITTLKTQSGTPEHGLRVAVVGGGCSGMSYKLDFEPAPKEGDKVFEKDGVKVFVDSKSYLFLKGMSLDYEGGLNGHGFVFSNPNAKKSCGCGSSFGV